MAVKSGGKVAFFLPPLLARYVYATPAPPPAFPFLAAGSEQREKKIMAIFSPGDVEK